MTYSFLWMASFLLLITGLERHGRERQIRWILSFVLYVIGWLVFMTLVTTAP